MIDVLSKATHNFIEHQLREASTEEQQCDAQKMYQADIDLICSGETKKAHFYYTNDFIQAVSMAMLFEEASDDETIIDLVNETTNLIAGSAKILASDIPDRSFDIGIPKFQGKDQSLNTDGTYRAFYINNKMMLTISLP